MFEALLLLFSTAHAAETELEWGGYGLPIASVNATDGVGFGVAGEIYARPADQEHGYRFKLTLSTWYTASLNYTSQGVDLEFRSTDWQVLGKAEYQGWANHRYAGVGGADVLVDHGALELGNKLAGPTTSLAVSRRLGESDALWFGQLYGKFFVGVPNPGGLMAQRDPLAANGALYIDVTTGLEVDSTDRWPMPMSGTLATVAAGLGNTWDHGTKRPVASVYAEVIRWTPITGRFVVGARVMADKTFGEQAHFTQFLTSGRRRDEIGYQQAMQGYGRLRTRGDGSMAALVEVRPYLGGTKHETWDFQFYLSAFAEEGFVFDGTRLGPHMPTVGGGPVILFQKASQLRPFVAYGWRAEEQGGRRVPSLQFSLALVDPL